MIFSMAAFSRIGFIFWLCCAGVLNVSAQDAVWVALIKGDGVPSAEQTQESARLQKMEPRLKSVFGFENYHLLHEATVPIGEKYAQWVLPRKDFYLKIRPLSGAGIKFELYRDKELLVEGKAYPTTACPLFIAGPDYQGGRLIFILQRSTQ